MSDVMLLGVLRMPMDFPFDELTHIQVVSRCREAADRIESDTRRIEDLERQLAECQQDAQRYQFIYDQVTHDGFTPVCQVVWKLDNNPEGVWANITDGDEMTRLIDEATVPQPEPEQEMLI